MKISKNPGPAEPTRFAHRLAAACAAAVLVLALLPDALTDAWHDLTRWLAAESTEGSTTTADPTCEEGEADCDDDGGVAIDPNG